MDTFYKVLGNVVVLLFLGFVISGALAALGAPVLVQMIVCGVVGWNWDSRIKPAIAKFFRKLFPKDEDDEEDCGKHDCSCD